MSDITLQAFDVSALPVNEGDEFLTLGILTGIQTPFPDQTGNPVAIPTDVYRVPMGKTAVTELIKALQEQVEKLPEPKKPSGIVVPGGNADAERIANDLSKLR